MNSAIPEAATIYQSINNLASQFLNSMTAGASGTGTFGQILSSITGTLDVIMLSFLAAGVTGFLVLCLYTQKLFIGLVTYVMVFSVLVVLVFGTWIVNSTY